MDLLLQISESSNTEAWYRTFALLLGTGGSVWAALRSVGRWLAKKDEEREKALHDSQLEERAARDKLEAELRSQIVKYDERDEQRMLIQKDMVNQLQKGTDTLNSISTLLTDHVNETRKALNGQSKICRLPKRGARKTAT